MLPVSVTVLAETRHRPLRDRIARPPSRPPPRAIAVGLTALTIAAAILGLACAASGRHPAQRARPPITSAGPVGVAAAYGYPRRCLSITILPDYPQYARADFDHSRPCGRYTGYSTAIFLRVDHVWRLVLNTTGYSCPVRGLPARAQAALGVCETPP